LNRTIWGNCLDRCPWGSGEKPLSFLVLFFYPAILIPTKGSQKMIYSTKEKETSSVPGVLFGLAVYAAFIIATAHAVVGGI